MQTDHRQSKATGGASALFGEKTPGTRLQENEKIKKKKAKQNGKDCKCQASSPAACTSKRGRIEEAGEQLKKRTKGYDRKRNIAVTSPGGGCMPSYPGKSMGKKLKKISFYSTSSLRPAIDCRLADTNPRRICEKKNK